MKSKYDVNRIKQYLQEEPDIIPDAHDGSYELLREVVKSYAKVPDYSEIDYSDLNLLYLSVIGTWKHGIDRKKETIMSSHLPDAEKSRLISVLDEIWEKAQNHAYSNEETDGNVQIGMFGTGFYSFKRKTTDQCSRDFIRMCVDIMDMTDDTAIFDRVETVLKADFHGMKAASASVILHCLKPETFPVMNGNMGADNIFEALGIKLRKKNEISTYIANCHVIRKFCNKNFGRKNYRVFDIAAWDLEKFLVVPKTEAKIDIEKLKIEIEAYKKEFPRIVKQENYKWRAVQCFQQNFDLEASDFAEMLKRALAKEGNLLTRMNFFAKAVILEIADYDPEYARNMFRNLFDESESVVNRIKQFEDDAEVYYNFKPNRTKSTYQDAKASSVYLFFRYPEKYYIYLSMKFENCARQLGYDNIPTAGSMERVQAYFTMADQIWEYAKTDEELIQLNRSRLDDRCYEDPENHILAEDLVYFMNWRYKDAHNDKADDIDDNQTLTEEADTSMDKDEMLEHKELQVDYPKNMILYGPPGTGKTYHTVLYAVAIIEGKKLEEVAAEEYSDVKKRYDKYVEKKQIGFTTFHQSYGYEEFIEGIKPVMEYDDEQADAAGKDVTYTVKAGVFKEFCENASAPVSTLSGNINWGFNTTPTVWKVSLGGTYDNPVREECMKNDHIRIGWDSYGEQITDETDFSAEKGRVVLNAFINKMKIGDVVFSCYSASTIDAIGVVTGEYEWHPEYDRLKRVRAVKWLVKDLKYNIVDMNGGANMTLATVYKMNISMTDVSRILEETRPKTASKEFSPNQERHVFIIDEINRGNISKIFGELITLIEDSKRIGQKEELKLRLPYSSKMFGIPGNVYVIGTMNTADRSIALIDTALRRRFRFVEMLPQPEVLKDVDVEGIDISEMLRIMNERIQILFDREHTIGHAYFMPLKEEPTMECLGDIFKNSIVPLLQEYFYNDYEKIRLVLADNQKTEDMQFVVKPDIDIGALFGDTDEDIDIDTNYKIQEEVFTKPETYLAIYRR